MPLLHLPRRFVVRWKRGRDAALLLQGTTNFSYLAHGARMGLLETDPAGVTALARADASKGADLDYIEEVSIFTLDGGRPPSSAEEAAPGTTAAPAALLRSPAAARPAQFCSAGADSGVPPALALEQGAAGGGVGGVGRGGRRGERRQRHEAKGQEVRFDGRGDGRGGARGRRRGRERRLHEAREGEGEEVRLDSRGHGGGGRGRGGGGGACAAALGHGAAQDGARGTA